MSHFTAAAARTTTLSAFKRAQYVDRFVRKDARTLSLRLAYGPQSNRTNQVTIAPAHLLALSSKAEVLAVRAALGQALARTGYDAVRCQEILADFDRLRKPTAEVA